MVYVTRKEHFNAAHKLYNPSWSEERNKEVFGKCANVNWHGHNFDLYVTVKGLPNLDTGFVIDLKRLRDIIRERVIDKLDHMNINIDVDFMNGILASTENIAIGIWQQLEEPIAAEGAQLHCVKLFETERNFVEYYGGI